MAQTQLTRIELLALKILTAFAVDYKDLAGKLDAALQKLDEIEHELNGPPQDNVAVRAFVVVPQLFDLETGKELHMPQNVMNDVKTVFSVEFDNLAKTKVDPPAAGVVTLSLVDAAGAVSSLGTVAVGSPGGSGMDGSKFTVIPNSPAGTSLGAATVKYDDTVSGGTPSDISFTWDIMFTDDKQAASAHVDTTTIETFPLT